MTESREAEGIDNPSRKKRRSPIPPGKIQRTDRRADILAAAEVLFAQRGYAAVSIRDIAKEASVPPALIAYYFDTKQGLLATIFEHRSQYITERIDRIKSVDCSKANEHAVEDLVRAWAEPVMALQKKEGEVFSLLVARTMWDPGREARAIIEQVYDALAHAFIDAMVVALSDRDRTAIVWGYEYALGALLMHVADSRVERLSHGEAITGDPRLCESFVHFVSSGFRSI